MKDKGLYNKIAMFITKLKAKWYLLFVKEPKEKRNTFSLNKINDVEDFLLFGISKCFLELKQWSKGELWFNNYEYPRKFIKEIKSYKLVLEDVKSLKYIKENIIEGKDKDKDYYLDSIGYFDLINYRW